MLWFATGAATGAQACEGSELVLEACVAPAVTAAAPDAVLHEYTHRAADLRRTALATGTVEYEQVIAAAYRPGVINDGILEAKARWRRSVPAGFEFVSDYGLSRSRATVRALTALPDPRLRSTLVAQYEATSHVIGLSAVATDFAIYHESGHVLQRAALRARGAPAGRHAQQPDSLLDRVLRAIATDSTAARRLKYLGSQDELEVRLQDLNRFHALLVAGRPIMDPFDSMRALTALGVPLEYEEVRQAFAAGERELCREDFDAGVAVEPVTATTIAVPFEDARELLLVRLFALQVDPSCWQHLLAKILFEAPGHL